MLMQGICSGITRAQSKAGASRRWRRVRSATIVGLALGLALIATGSSMATQPVVATVENKTAPRCTFPKMNPEHPHTRALLENAMRYMAPESGTSDATSGYPVEGWNHEPQRGLALRSFTQLTAIGEWAEVLANVVAGCADTPYLSRQQALDELGRIAQSLRQDQQDPATGAKGLLGNFLDLAPGRRMGPLASTVEKQRFLDAFGAEKGEAIWQALKAKGWLYPQGDGHEAAIQREAGYGAAFFDGPLAAYDDAATKERIMALLDQRTVTIVFGDNANLTTSIANSVGALLTPAVRNEPHVVEVRNDLEQFLENQHEGYAYLYNASTGLFFFGWDANRNRWSGWQDGAGNWLPGHMDYLVNEFRGPTAFVIMRYGLPATAFANLGFKIKPYVRPGHDDLYVLAPWEGSAFQSLGLGLSVADGGHRSWQVLLENAVGVQIDYARRHNLPGFLSESYIGDGSRYTGEVGIPDIAVTTSPRITNVASLYTLGVAYGIAPAAVERFLADNWSIVSTLLTDHGPWEGFDTGKQEPIRIQTTAHTLSLALGLLGTGPENMMRYLEHKGLIPRLEEVYQSGDNVDLMSDKNQQFAWAQGGGTINSTRRPDVFQIQGEQVKQMAVAFVSPREQGMNLSNGLLSLRYRNSEPLSTAVIKLKPAVNGSTAAPLLPSELFVRVSQTNGQEAKAQVPLPATIGLATIKEVVLECAPTGPNGTVDLAITGFEFTSYAK